jgi:hypothetical protein
MRLSGLTAILAVAAASAGLFWPGGGSPYTATSLRGETVQLYGQGLYRFETLRDGSGFKGLDLFVLFVAVPLLVLFALRYRSRSVRGGLLLAGTLGFFVYNSASLTFGYAYNQLFLLYLAQWTASLFAFILVCMSFDVEELPGHFGEPVPRRGIAVFLYAVGASLILVWVGLDILPALVRGQAPALSGHTTLPTHARDVGLIAPAALLAGMQLWRRAPLGYLIAPVVLVVGCVLGTGVLALSAAQLVAGVLTAGETIAFVAPFVILTLLSLWCSVLLLRHTTEATLAQRGYA